MRLKSSSKRLGIAGIEGFNKCTSTCVQIAPTQSASTSTDQQFAATQLAVFQPQDGGFMLPNKIATNQIQIHQPSNKQAQRNRRPINAPGCGHMQADFVHQITLGSIK